MDSREVDPRVTLWNLQFLGVLISSCEWVALLNLSLIEGPARPCNQQASCFHSTHHSGHFQVWTLLKGTFSVHFRNAHRVLPNGWDSLFSLAKFYISPLMYNSLPLRGPGGSEDFQVGVEGADGIVTMTPIEGKGHSFCRLWE